MDPNHPDHPAPDENLRTGESGNGREEAWQTVFEQCEPGLRGFLRGKLNQEADVDDCLQAVYVKMIQSKADVPAGVRTAWLFTVASNEAALLWRRRSTSKRILEKQATKHTDVQDFDASKRLIENETADRARQVIQTLPDSTQDIIRLRTHDALTFQQIADRLDLPLGTVLTRMRRALEKVKSEIEANDNDS